MKLATVHDRRTMKTRHALRAAFTKLVFDRRYEEISVTDIVAEANVGKSTFYLHFKSKDDLFKSIVEGMLAELAASTASEYDPMRLRGLIAHFWERRRLGSVVFGGALTPSLSRSLAAMIEAADPQTASPNGGVAARLRAIQLAAGQISLLHAWLKGETAADIDQIVTALRSMAVPGHEPGASPPT